VRAVRGAELTVTRSLEPARSILDAWLQIGAAKSKVQLALELAPSSCHERRVPVSSNPRGCGSAY